MRTNVHRLSEHLIGSCQQYPLEDDRIYRYRKMHESSKRRAMAELRQLQTEQLWRREIDQEPDCASFIADTSILVYFKIESYMDRRS